MDDELKDLYKLRHTLTEVVQQFRISNPGVMNMNHEKSIVFTFLQDVKTDLQRAITHLEYLKAKSC